MKEKSLLTFTILNQMSIGILITTLLMEIYLMNSINEVTIAWEMILDALLLICTLIAIPGLVASLFHLGSPEKAFKAIGNLQSSWLSREILFATLFTLGLTSLFLLNRITTATPTVLLSGLITVAAFGIGTIYCMSRVYMLRTM